MKESTNNSWGGGEKHTQPRIPNEHHIKSYQIKYKQTTTDFITEHHIQLLLTTTAPHSERLTRGVSDDS